jgi:hypothetical protein
MNDVATDPETRPAPIRLPWPAWASAVIGSALLPDDVEAHVLPALAGWEPSTSHVARLEEALVSLDPRHARGALALALRLVADTGSVHRASASALALVALVSKPLEEGGPDAEPDVDDDGAPPLACIGMYQLHASLADVELTARDGHGAIVLAAETSPDDAEADPRAALRYVLGCPAVLPRVARLAQDVLGGALGGRQLARRLRRLGDGRVAALEPGVLDVDARGRLYLGGRPVLWRRARRTGRTDRCYASLATRAGRLILGLVVGDAPAAVASEVSSQARVALLGVGGVRLSSSLRLEPALRPSPRALRAWRLLRADLPAERPRGRRKGRASS